MGFPPFAAFLNVWVTFEAKESQAKARESQCQHEHHKLDPLQVEHEDKLQKALRTLYITGLAKSQQESKENNKYGESSKDMKADSSLTLWRCLKALWKHKGLVFIWSHGFHYISLRLALVCVALRRKITRDDLLKALRPIAEARWVYGDSNRCEPQHTCDAKYARQMVPELVPKMRQEPDRMPQVYRLLMATVTYNRSAMHLKLSCIIYHVLAYMTYSVLYICMLMTNSIWSFWGWYALPQQNKHKKLWLYCSATFLSQQFSRCRTALTELGTFCCGNGSSCSFGLKPRICISDMQCLRANSLLQISSLKRHYAQGLKRPGSRDFMF